MKLVLASASPRRRALLGAAGIACVVDSVEIDESRRVDEAPMSYVARLALEKAAAGARRHPEDVVLAADTAVVLGDELFGKPVDLADARRMLRRLSGRAHDVLTGFAVVAGPQPVVEVVSTGVVMAAFSDADIEWYIESGEPMDKAGGYAVQGLASRWVTRIEGSYTNVVGLPVAAVYAALSRVAPGVVADTQIAGTPLSD